MMMKQGLKEILLMKELFCKILLFSVGIILYTNFPLSLITSIFLRSTELENGKLGSFLSSRSLSLVMENVIKFVTKPVQYMRNIFLPLW